MSTTYRALLARPGALALLLICATSWLSYSGYGLALILAVHAATRSFTTVGVATAVQAAGVALAAPSRGRLADRHGAPALRALAVAHGLGAAAVVVGLQRHGAAVIVAGAALVGLSAPPLIGVARARWRAVAGPDLVPTAHAVNAALSDVAQIAGPPLVAVITLLASPRLALVGFASGVVAAAFVLAHRLPPGDGPPSPVRHDVLGLLRASPGLRLLAAVDVLTAGWLAALELAVIAFAARHGRPAGGALTLTALAVGSIAMSLLAGSGRLRGAPRSRYLAGAALPAAVLPLAVLAGRLGELAPVLVVAGAGFGLLNVVVYQALDDVVAQDRQVEAFTWLTTASGLGVAVGSLASGRLAGGNVAGLTASLVLAAGLALGALVVAVIGRRAMR
jgi:predicted MFS family arabinose efflux permease